MHQVNTMSRRAHASALRVEQLEDRLNPAGSIIPAGEFNWMQYSPTGELGQLVWNGNTLVYRARVQGSWFNVPIAETADYTAGQYNKTDEVQHASQTAQLVFTADGTPHVLFLEKQWNGVIRKYQSLIQHYARVGTAWQKVETIVPNWTSQWGPNNLVAAAGPNNSIHLIFTETNVAATGVGAFGSGSLHYGTNKNGRWSFTKIADTADMNQDIWFAGARWAPRFLSLDVDAQNAAHVTYTPQFYIAGAFSTVRSTLMYASNRGGTWRSQTVMAPQDGTADAGLGASVAVAPNGQVAIASYYVDRYASGSPQTSKLMYHTLTPSGWTHATVASTSDGYVAEDGPRFTGFAPQLLFDSAGRANIVFSDDASEHLPISFANQFAGQIRLATLNGSSWSLQTIYRQNNPLNNQLFYPIAATFNGQITFAGLNAVSMLDGNRNPTRTDFALIDVNAPYGLNTPSGVGTPPPYVPDPSLPPIASPQTTSVPTGWAVAFDAGLYPSQVFVFRPDGSASMVITPFGDAYRGGVRIARGDVNGDGVADLITATGPGIATRIRIWDGTNGRMVADYDPFPGYTGGLWVAVGDMNADGLADVAVGTDVGNVPHVKVFNGGSYNLLASFFAYAPGFVGGVRVGMGDINRDGFADLVTAPGVGGGPHIAMFDGFSITIGLGPQRVAPDFFMYDRGMTAGLSLAVGDIDGDGYADIITGPSSGPAHLRIASGRSLSNGRGPGNLTSMIAWSGNTSGLRVAAVDADGDGRLDVIATPGGLNGGRVAMYGAPALLANNAGAVQWFDRLPNLLSSVYVG